MALDAERSNRSGIAPFDRYLDEAASRYPRICPKCGNGYVIEGTKPGDKYGICAACFNRARSMAAKARLRDLKTAKPYDAMRKQASRLGIKFRLSDEEIESWL